MQDLLESYLLTRELRPSSERWYREVTAIFSAWLAGRDFTADNLSRFLAEKQRAGLSADYRKSLRNGLVALLRFHGDDSRVRPVKLTTLAHETWNDSQIRNLLAAVDTVIAGQEAFLTYIPPELTAHVASGTIWPLRTSGEYFRRTSGADCASGG